MALLGVLLITLILSILGLVSVNLAMQEVQMVADLREETATRYLAEAGLELVTQWFNQPDVKQGQPGELLGKRFNLVDRGPSFFDMAGRSQFTGTSAAPDILYDAARPADDRLLNDPGTGWFAPLYRLGEIRTLKVFSPQRADLLCTVEVTAATSRATRTVSLQLAAVSLRPIRSGVQIGVGSTTVPFPVVLHWGSAKVNGDQLLPPVADVPTKSLLAPVSDVSYADMGRREDRWFELLLAGAGSFDALFAPSSAIPSNIQEHQEPMPGLHLDRWPYEDLKKYAKAFGTYYVRGGDGLLYRDGRVAAGTGIDINDVMRSASGEDNRGLVFVDTLDQKPPRPDNLGTVIIDVEYAEGVFVINANVHLKSYRVGQSVSALSPPDMPGGARIAVMLNNIHVNGLLHVAGNLTYEGDLRLFGALVVQGAVSPITAGARPIEAWYNYDFSRGYYPGLPVVYPAPGTWQERY